MALSRESHITIVPLFIRYISNHTHTCMHTNSHFTVPYTCWHHTYTHTHTTQFFDDVEEWSDVCNTKDTPPNIQSTEEAIAAHQELKQTFQTCYSLVREEGHKIIEKLRKPVGTSSVPMVFVARTRIVKEILESLFDENNWLNEQVRTNQGTLSSKILHVFYLGLL